MVVWFPDACPYNVEQMPNLIFIINVLKDCCLLQKSSG